ncbi:MAG: AMIN domain-containing protein, partial [Rhodospirillaceae bacterium]|nr:AMIN domain-containing protein [Rhodospirillaceae bacterium]
MTGRMARRFGTVLPVLMLGALLALSGPEAARAASASGARLGIHGDGVTRFVVDLSESVAFKTFVQADPYRIIIDTPGVDWSGNGISKPWGSVNGMRTEDGRVILDLRKPAIVKSAFIIAPRDGLGWRLVVDLSETTREGFLASVGGGAISAKPVVLKPPPGVKPLPAARPAPAQAAPAVVEEPAPAPAAVEAAHGSGSRIVLTSPNAGPSVMEAQPPAIQAAVPEPMAVAPPVPVERPARGLPMLSAPMPPPPERPVQAMAAPAQPPA